MFKFLRRYSKWLLAIFGTLLMITFLVPFAITNFSQRAAAGTAVWATVGDGEEVSGAVRARCASQLELLQRLGVGVPVFGRLENPAHWYLLVREAEAAGMVGGGSLSRLPQAQLQQLLTLANQGSAAFLDETLSRLDGVNRLFALYRNAGKWSDHRLRQEAERLFHEVDARLVVLEANEDEIDWEPSAEAIEEQLEAYRDVEPGSGERGFGYRLPDRFKVEWLTIETEDIRAMVEASGAIDGIALSKHWQRYDGDETKKFPRFREGLAPPPQVREDLLSELVETRRTRIEKFVMDRIRSAWRRLPARNGFLELPEDWARQRPAFEALAEAIQAEFAGLALPTYQAIGDRWLTVDDLITIDDLATAGSEKFGPWTDTRTLFGALKEFGGHDVLMVQAGVTGPVLHDPARARLILYRVTDVDPSRPPESIDEVRDEVVRDLRRLRHFEQLSERRDEVETQAREEGLLAVAIRHGAEVVDAPRVTLYDSFLLDFQLQRNAPLSRQPSRLPVIGPDETVIAAILDRAFALPRDQTLGELPATDRIFALTVDDAMAVLLVELMSERPLNRDRFEKMASSQSLQSLLLGDELTEAEEGLAEAFSFESLVARHQFRVRQTETTDEEEEGDEEADVATASSR